ncbi:MAG: peptidoglycan DD-metalloendopeptidase family protein [Gammaproteobacteria bacterium]|nr:peptidoglycan DD-metalloendopeptidase family protein [Gammaproteobacteria bacterium]MCP5299280.1 peptidoglycan DD-metalloendopeptidase family protein [Chromatiaceae bacterium]
MRALLVVVTSAGLLAACTANWRAPVETRGSSGVRQARVETPRPGPGPVVAIGEYRVQRGDTLYGIAWQQGIDYRQIARWNGLRPPYRIYVGQTLSLRAPREPHIPPADPPPTVRNPPRTSTVTAPRPAVSTRPARLVWSWPAHGRITATFDANDRLRSGIKIAGRAGDSVTASESGRVVYSGSGLIGYGRLIIIKHNENYLSAYGHNRKIMVAEGDQVAKGQKIAEMGFTNNGDPLLHFEIRRDGKPVDPIRLLPKR